MAASCIVRLFSSVFSKAKSFLSLCHGKNPELLTSCVRPLSSSTTVRTRFPSRQGRRRHCSSTYRTMLRFSVSSGHFSVAESIVSKALSGAFRPDLSFLNSAIHFCCSRRHLFSRALDLYSLTLRPNAACCPSLETFSLLLAGLLNRFGKPPMCYTNLGTVRSLVNHMKILGVALDTLTLNLIINAYSLCMDMDEAVRFFHEMNIYGCQPNEHTYQYIVQGFCEKGLVEPGFCYFREMRGKEFVPTRDVYMILISSLAVNWRYDDCIRVLFDMLRNSLVPDLSTYKTILDEMCSGGKAEAAFGLLEYLDKKLRVMDPWVYPVLLMGLNSAPKSSELELLFDEFHWC